MSLSLPAIVILQHANGVTTATIQHLTTPIVDPPAHPEFCGIQDNLRPGILSQSNCCLADFLMTLIALIILSLEASGVRNPGLSQ